MPQPRWTWSTLAIVSTTVALVFGPVLIPREIARWYLAAAANAYRVHDLALGRHHLERAVSWDASVVRDGDFLIAQMGSTSSDDKLRLLEKAIEIDPRTAVLAPEVADALIEDFDFQRAVRAYKMAFPDGQPRRPETLNQLAYMRAQAGVELDQALKDINRALDMAGNDPAMLDTKAWVLHALGKDLEALAVMNDALKKLEKTSRKAQSPPPPEIPAAEKSAAQKSAAETGDVPARTARLPAEDESAELEKPISQTELTRRLIQAAKVRLGREQWNMALYRFHRLRIYEALNRPLEAMHERQWLLEHRVPIVDELF